MELGLGAFSNMDRRYPRCSIIGCADYLGWAVNQMGDSIIFMGGIAVGSLITMFICMVAIISDDIRMWKEKEREFRQENEDN